MRRALAFTFASLTLPLIACGGDDEMMMMEEYDDSGFYPPGTTLKANVEMGTNNWVEVGDADLSCLGTAPSDMATTTTVTLSTKVTDFQEDTPVADTMVIAFQGNNYMSPFDTKTADADANISFTVPTGTTRFGFRMESENAFPTFLLNQKLESPSNATQTKDEIQSVSKTTAATLAAFIGTPRTPGTGVIAGALRDCQKREISGFVATLSSTSMTATPVAGAEAYYFKAETKLPQQHKQVPWASGDGIFMIIEVPTTSPMAYVQMWGFPTAADMDKGMSGLKLVAELEVPILADNVITGSYEPLRN
jgi:hypothetical protein